MEIGVISPLKGLNNNIVIFKISRKTSNKCYKINNTKSISRVR